MEGSNSGRLLNEQGEFKYDKWTIKKDPKLRVNEVTYKKDPCAKCGDKIEEQVTYEQTINVTGYVKVPVTLLEKSGGKSKENSMLPTSSRVLTDRRTNEVDPADVGLELKPINSGDSEPEVLTRVRKNRGNEKDRRRRKRRAEAQARKIAGVSKTEWDQLKKLIRGQMN